MMASERGRAPFIIFIGRDEQNGRFDYFEESDKSGRQKM